jgi:hypothetical protein|tara:strand:+ start:515 stop:760 length:246 start_codon:yes stop_codon:yes gene_type:complete
MIIEKLKELAQNIFTGNLSERGKILITVSIGWIIFIGYLTWWNGIKGPGLDKSFRWDEWIWFGIIPATVPYLFYYIWRKKD